MIGRHDHINKYNVTQSFKLPYPPDSTISDLTRWIRFESLITEMITWSLCIYITPFHPYINLDFRKVLVQLCSVVSILATIEMLCVFSHVTFGFLRNYLRISDCVSSLPLDSNDNYFSLHLSWSSFFVSISSLSLWLLSYLVQFTHLASRSDIQVFVLPRLHRNP